MLSECQGMPSGSIIALRPRRRCLRNSRAVKRRKRRSFWAGLCGLVYLSRCGIDRGKPMGLSGGCEGSEPDAPGNAGLRPGCNLESLARRA